MKNTTNILLIVGLFIIIIMSSMFTYMWTKEQQKLKELRMDLDSTIKLKRIESAIYKLDSPSYTKVTYHGKDRYKPSTSEPDTLYIMIILRD